MNSLLCNWNVVLVLLMFALLLCHSYSNTILRTEIHSLWFLYVECQHFRTKTFGYSYETEFYLFDSNKWIRLKAKNLKIYTITLLWYTTTLFHMQAIYYFVEDDSKLQLSGVGEFHSKIEYGKKKTFEWTGNCWDLKFLIF